MWCAVSWAAPVCWAPVSSGPRVDPECLGGRGGVEQSEATVFLQDRDLGGKQDEARLGTGVRRSGVGGKEGIPSKGSS